jgi:hypothetical protein
LPTRAGLTDLSAWTLVEDPQNGHFTASVTATKVLLSANGGPVPSGTDIGYQSFDEDTPGASAQGYAFSPLFDSSLAIDFSILFRSGSSGMLGIGFGIGEHGNGMNSARVAMLTGHGIPLTFGDAARVSDLSLTPLPLFYRRGRWRQPVPVLSGGERRCHARRIPDPRRIRRDGPRHL